MADNQHLKQLYGTDPIIPETVKNNPYPRSLKAIFNQEEIELIFHGPNDQGLGSYERWIEGESGTNNLLFIQAIYTNGKLKHLRLSLNISRKIESTE